ncbi:hypothetical protein [Marinobacter sp. LV10R520-4]|uniref:hypothetical protein n=1 Tax=Marinobacter sp. LV10R520-4 TaxID=1761796 RepID=UPI001E40805C|nr:hypothetical protein [Marinobacter sp. LV10R520-4]
MTFDGVRHVGGSLLASAGIGGIVLGFAARPVLGRGSDSDLRGVAGLGLAPDDRAVAVVYRESV